MEADRAEAYAATMIESSRLSGSIDQIAGLIHFFPIATASGGKEMVDLSTLDVRAWDANVAGLAEEVEKVATLLQREEPVWYESVVVG